jgi:hypothetical protein
MNKVYQRLAALVGAIENCVEAKNEEWEHKHLERIHDIMETSPSGSGIDNGTSIELSKCDSKKLTFSFSYHHMNENGMYDGWTDHELVVTPSLQFGFNLRITGKNRNGVKDYFYEIYYTWLMEDTTDKEELCKADIEERKEVVESLTNLQMEQESLADSYSKAPVGLSENERDIYKTLRRNEEALETAIEVLEEHWRL